MKHVTVVLMLSLVTLTGCGALSSILSDSPSTEVNYAKALSVKFDSSFTLDLQKEFNLVVTELNSSSQTELNQVVAVSDGKPGSIPVDLVIGEIKGNVLAATTCKYGSYTLKNSKAITTTSCRIVFNIAYLNNGYLTNRYDGKTKLNSVIKHELAHAFGLDHFTQQQGEIMYPVLNEDIALNFDRKTQTFFGQLSDFIQFGAKTGYATVLGH